MDCERCPFELRIVNLEKSSEKNSDQHKEFYEDLKKAAVSQGRSETIYNQIFSTLSDIKADVAELKAVPKRRWDTIIAAAITALVGILIGVLVKGGM